MIAPGTAIEYRAPGLAARWLAGELVSDDGRRCVVKDAAGTELAPMPARHVRLRVSYEPPARRPCAPMAPLEEPRTISTPSFARSVPPRTSMSSPALERAFAEQIEGRTTIEPEPAEAWAAEPPPISARAPIVRPSFESFHKAAPVRSDVYLAFVREHPCCVCEAPGPSDPHHYGPRGMGAKTDDTLTVPLCRVCHDDFHQRRAVQRRNVQQTETLFWRVEALLLTAWFKRGEAFEAVRRRA